MKTVVTAQQMRLLEQDAMQRTGATSEDLMANAAQAMHRVLLRELGTAEGKVCVFACGRGGNGGDGALAARLFALSGGRAILLDVMPEASMRTDTQHMYALAAQTENVWITQEYDSMPQPSAWVDCIFGIGLQRAPGEALERLFRRIERDRRNGSLVLSCDIPSGLQADTGHAPGAWVEADITATFEAPKPGHFLGNGLDACGRLVVCPIGIPPECYPRESIQLLEPGDIAPACTSRRHASHKGDYGHLLLVAGSFGMAGAAALAAEAALRSGVGLVTIACVRSIVPILQTLVPCAMCIPLPEEEGAIAKEAVPALLSATQGKTALLVGPGCSTRCAPEVVEALLRTGLPCLLDADALNLLSRNRGLLPLLHKGCLLTPHPGEAARLCALPSDPIGCAKALSALGCTALYKGATSVICQGDTVYLSASGSPGMARGGSGDVLSGIAAALLARGFSPLAAAQMASEAHGLAGEAAARAYGETGMTAQEIVSALPEVFLHARA